MIERNPSDWRDALADQIERTAEWRAQKTDENPDDPRNTESAEALATLAKRLRDLPPLHQGIISLRRMEKRIEPFAFSRITSENLSRYGFGTGEDGDPERFLDGLIDDVEGEGG